MRTKLYGAHDKIFKKNKEIEYIAKVFFFKVLPPKKKIVIDYVDGPVQPNQSLARDSSGPKIKVQLA